MSTPTDMPHASLSRIQFRVSECGKMSRIRRAGRFGTFWYVLYCTILAATFSASQQGYRVNGGVSYDERQVYSSLPASVTESFHLDLLADVGLTELRYADGVRDPHQHGALAAPSSLTATVQTCGRRCLDPHPGAFRWWNGQANGCWIQVWRAWPEGCRHFQWYNSCNGVWDAHPNGAPKVYWDCCVH